MIDRLEMLKKRLQRIYDLAMASDNEKHFFLWLYDYVRVFDTEDDLGGVFEQIKSMKDQEYQVIRDLIPKAKREIEKAYGEVVEFVKKHKIEHKVIRKNLDEYRMIKDGQYWSSRGYLESLYDKLTYALMTMVEDESLKALEFVQKFGDVTDERRISAWTFSPSYTRYDIITEGTKQIQETRLWYCWDKIVLAFKAIDDYESKILEDILNRKRQFEAMNWAGLRSEMKEIINGSRSPNKKPYEFIIDDYRYNLAKIHHFVIEYIDSSPDAVRKSKKGVDLVVPTEVRWSIKQTENLLKLTINDKTHDYENGTPYQVILSFLIDNGGETSTQDLYEKITEDHGGGKMTQKKKKHVWQKCYDLRAKINNDYWVPQFLIFDYNTVKFNSSYRQI